MGAGGCVGERAALRGCVPVRVRVDGWLTGWLRARVDVGVCLSRVGSAGRASLLRPPPSGQPANSQRMLRVGVQKGVFRQQPFSPFPISAAAAAAAVAVDRSKLPVASRFWRCLPRTKITPRSAAQTKPSSISSHSGNAKKGTQILLNATHCYKHYRAG